MKIARIGLLSLSMFCLGTAAASAKEISMAVANQNASDIEKLVAMMSGNWKARIGEQEVMMSVAPVNLSEVPNAMYVELADAKALTNPYRQVVLQAYSGGGKLKLRTLEFRKEKGRLGSVIGLWAAPDSFPAIQMADMLGTLDLELQSAGDGFEGKTAAPFPTAAGGAMTMTSDMKVDATSVSIADRGFDADGKVVWGPAAGEWYRFEKVASPVKVTRFDGGVVAVDFVNENLGAAAGDGDQVVCNYVGYLADGKVFDRSFDRGEPFKFAKGTKLIAGANAAFGETRKGMKRRVVIPASMAYGEAGRGAVIPPNSTLYFDIEVLEVVKQQSAAPVQVIAPQIGEQPAKK